MTCFGRPTNTGITPRHRNAGEEHRPQGRFPERRHVVYRTPLHRSRPPGVVHRHSEFIQSVQHLSAHRFLIRVMFGRIRCPLPTTGDDRNKLWSDPPPLLSHRHPNQIRQAVHEVAPSVQHSSASSGPSFQNSVFSASPAGTDDQSSDQSTQIRSTSHTTIANELPWNNAEQQDLWKTHQRG